MHVLVTLSEEYFQQCILRIGNEEEESKNNALDRIIVVTKNNILEKMGLGASQISRTAVWKTEQTVLYNFIGEKNR